MKRIRGFIQRVFRRSGNSSPDRKSETRLKGSHSLDSADQSKDKPDRVISAKLSIQEIRFLVEKAESCIASENLEEALKCYTQLIENTPPESSFLKRRGWIHRMTGEFDIAICDMDSAIKLAPDDGTSYWERGACYANKLALLTNINKTEKTRLLNKVLEDYKASVERVPTSSEAWLAILETEMLLHNWDDAISNYGICKPYIDSREYQVVRSWLGCIALIFTDESIEEEDIKFLEDSTIRLKRYTWCVSEIDSLFKELGEEGYSKEKLNRANEIHTKFLNHFDEPPIRL